MYWSQVRVLAGPPNPVKSTFRNLENIDELKRNLKWFLKEKDIINACNSVMEDHLVNWKSNL